MDSLLKQKRRKAVSYLSKPLLYIIMHSKGSDLGDSPDTATDNKLENMVARETNSHES